MHNQQHTPSLDMTDTALAKQVLSGNQKAFEVLVRRYHTPLFNFIAHFFGDENLADDVLQEVFISFYLSLPRLKTGGTFRSWLFHVAHNYCVDEFRRRTRSALSFSQLEKSEGELTGLCALPDPGPLPEEVAERHNLQALLHEAIQTLPLKFRSIVILRYAYQLSFPEIGQILSIPETTAKTYFYRAKPLLRKSIMEHL